MPGRVALARGTDTAFRPAVRRGPGPGRPRPAHFGRQWLLALSGIPRHGLRTTRRAARATGQRQGGRRAGHASGALPHRRDEARLRDAHPRAPRPPAPALSVGAVIGRLQQRFPEAFPRKPAPKLPLKVASATQLGAMEVHATMRLGDLRDTAKRVAKEKTKPGKPGLG